MPTPGIAIVGTGMIAAVHRRAALLAGADIRGVAASSPQRALEVAQSWGVPRAYRDIEEVVADPQVQVVHVCTPNHLHRPMAQAALEAGKHVVCEKPLATTLEDARAIADRLLTRMTPASPQPAHTATVSAPASTPSSPSRSGP